ncbi:MAG: DUF3048 domain-containing protein [Lachnospiraceae bacterium]|nr:DUF3048 domain-containing protein [Lachnospiraceae bacterium]
MKRKSLLALMMVSVVTMSLAGCGGKEEVQAPVEEVPFDSIVENAVDNKKEEVTEEASTEEQTVVEEESHEGMYRSEITNEWIDESLKNQRPIAVMVDNEKTALPHYGLTEADVVYEIMNSTANGRITRLMAIVKDWGKIQQFGSIRSARPTNFMLAAEWNAVVCHDGGPFYIDEYLKKSYTNNFSGTFGRVDNGKSREYTEYILEGDLDKNFSNSNYSTEYNEHYEGEHFVFSDEEIDLAEKSGAMDATEVKLPFPHNSSTLKYNEETGTYDYYEYGNAHVDPQHNNAVLTFENVILQDCSFSQLDENGYMIYNVIGSGDNGYYLTNGKAVPISWIKSGESDITLFLDQETGEQIEMNTGKTYIALVPSDTWDEVSIQ